MAVLKISTNEQNFINGLKRASGSVGELAGTMNDKLANSFKAADFYTKNFEKGLGRLANSFKDVGQGMTLGLTLPLGLLGKAASDAFAEFDALRRALGTVEPTVSGLGDRLKELREIAKMPGIGFQEAIQGDVRLRSVGISAATSAKILREFANAVAMTGGGKAQLNEITIQLGQMAAKGKVLAQDLRPIIENAPAVATALKNLFGTVSSEAISEQLEKTGKSSTEMINMLLVEMAKAPRVTGGWKNSLENLGDTLFVAKSEMFEVAANIFDLQGKMEGIAKTVEGFVQGFKDLPEPVQKTILGLTALIAIAGPLTYGIGLLTTALATLTTTAGITTMAIGGVVAIISALALSYISAYEEGVKIDKATQTLNQTYLEAELSIRKEVDAIQDNIEVLRDSSASIGDVKTAKENLIKINPEFKSAISGDIINFSALADIAGKTADELLRVAKYQNLIKQKETAVKTLDTMGKSTLSGLSPSQLIAGGLVGDALNQGGSNKDAFKEIKDENERKIRENIWFIDKTIEKEFGDLSKKYAKKDSPANKALTAGLVGKSDDSAMKQKWQAEEKYRSMIREGKEKWLKKLEDDAKKEDELQRDVAVSHKKTLDESLRQRLEYFAKLVGLETQTQEGKREDKVYKELGLSTPDEIKEVWDKRIAAMMEGQAKEVARRKKATDEEYKDAEDKKKRTQEDINQFGLDMMSGIAESIIAGDSFNGILKQALTALGNFAIQLGKQYYTIAKLKELIFKDGVTSKSALGLIVGGTIVKGMASRMTVPKLAEGGMATNPTLAMIGDNKSGKEMVLPFEKTGQFANMIAQQMGGGGGDFIHTTRISGNDLLILTERAKRAR